MLQTHVSLAKQLILDSPYGLVYCDKTTSREHMIITQTDSGKQDDNYKVYHSLLYVVFRYDFMWVLLFEWKHV